MCHAGVLGVHLHAVPGTSSANLPTLPCCSRQCPVCLTTFLSPAGELQAKGRGSISCMKEVLGRPHPLACLLSAWVGCVCVCAFGGRGATYVVGAQSRKGVLVRRVPIGRLQPIPLRFWPPCWDMHVRLWGDDAHSRCGPTAGTGRLDVAKMMQC